MWSAINVNEFQTFLNQNVDLMEFANDIVLYKAPNGLIYLPKFTYLTRQYINNYIDPTFKDKNIEIEFTKDLFQEQIEMITPFLNQYQINNSMTGTLKARPGAGKTVMGIYLACTMKKVCLIMLNNTALVEQWIDTILNFTDCTEDDIGWIQGNRYDVENKKFIIGMVQTFCSKVKNNLFEFYNKIKEIGIGFVLYDECHHSISGPKYALSSLVLNTNNIVGLSATPYLSGLQEFLMVNTVGPIISDTRRYEIIPKCYLLKFNSNLDKKSISAVYRAGDMIKQRAKYNSYITDNENYLYVIQKLNKKLLDKGHRVLNIVFTQKQVQLISETLEKNNIHNIQFYSKQRELNKEEDKCLVATYKFAGEGFDYKQLSALIIATPLSGRKSLIQTIGRILRSTPDKLSPEVYILIDTGCGSLFLRTIPQITKIISDEFNIECSIINI